MRQAEGLALSWLLLAGLALRLLPRERVKRHGLICIAAFLLLSAWTAISLAWTESDERTLAEVARVAHYLVLLVLTLTLVTRARWRQATAGIACGAFVIVLASLLGRLAPTLLHSGIVHAAFTTDRLSYPLNYWNAVGAWAAMSLGLALAFSAHARRAWMRAMCGAMLPACGLAIYLTYSRSAIIAAIAAVLLVVALGRNRWTAALHVFVGAIAVGALVLTVRAHPEIARATGAHGAIPVGLMLAGAALACGLCAVATQRAAADEKWRIPSPFGRLAAAVLIVVALIAVATQAQAIEAGWKEFRNPSEPARTADPAARLLTLSGTRYKHWVAAVDESGPAPLQGTGAGTYEFWWSRTGTAGFVRDAHSLYFEALGELGWPGLLLTILAVGSLAAGVIRALRSSRTQDIGLVAGLASAYFVFVLVAGVDWMWESTAVSALGLLCAGVAIGGLSRRRRALTPLPRALLIVLAVIAGAVQIPGLVAVSEVRSSQRAFARGDLESAKQHADDAAHAEPWAASPLVQRGLLSESEGRLPDASRDIERAIAREPTNWRGYLLIARIRAEMGDAPGALVAFDRARRLRPRSLFVFPRQ